MNRFLVRNADNLGILFSFLCIVHCVLTPFLIIWLTQSAFLQEEFWIHMAFWLFCLVAVVHAQAHKPSLWVTRGLWFFISMMFSAIVFEDVLSNHTFWMYFSSLGLIITHSINLWNRNHDPKHKNCGVCTETEESTIPS
jgi:FtsH-binding integral membrane protein